MDLNLPDLLLGLNPPERGAEETRFRVRSIPSAQAHFVGLDPAGFPCILLRSGNTDMRAPIQLAAIEARFAVPCHIWEADGQERQETLTVIVCTSPDRQVQSYFLHVCETIIRIVGPTPSFHEIVDTVQRLVDLFRELSRPASRSVIGLLGELCFVNWSNNTITSVRAWRSGEDDRFDFAIEDVRLEVKASRERLRAHNFSAEQCLPPAGTIGVLASLFIESSGGGVSLMEVIREIQRKLANDERLVLKVQQTVAESLGESLPIALSMRFDERIARSSLRLYDLSTIPAVRTGIPPEVTQVHFQSDLRATPNFSREDLIARSARLLDLLPAT